MNNLKIINKKNNKAILDLPTYTTKTDIPICIICTITDKSLNAMIIILITIIITNKSEKTPINTMKKMKKKMKMMYYKKTLIIIMKITNQ